MTRKNSIAVLVKSLEDLRSRPAMEMGNDCDVNVLEAYLQGFEAACAAQGLSFPFSIRQEVWVEHGWEACSYGVEEQIRDSGLSDKEIVLALIDLEIAMWKKWK